LTQNHAQVKQKTYSLNETLPFLPLSVGRLMTVSRNTISQVFVIFQKWLALFVSEKI
jgi:hypothetical protein